MEKYNCPKCHREMTKGYVYAERRFKWSDNPRKAFFSIEDETILPINLGWTHKKRTGYRCEECKIVMFEY
jgi:hypothetical protein